VSARLTISAYENLMSAAERRSLINKESKVNLRISDFSGMIPAITGKIELVYEGEQEGAGIVAQNLIGKAIRTQFLNYFPDPDQMRKQKNNPYQQITDWFGKGNMVDLLHDHSEKEYIKTLGNIPGLKDLIKKYQSNPDSAEQNFMMEFALYALVEYSLLSKHPLEKGMQFKDLLSSMFSMPEDDFSEEL